MNEQVERDEIEPQLDARQRIEQIDAVLTEQLPRYAEALDRLGRS